MDVHVGMRVHRHDIRATFKMVSDNIIITNKKNHDSFVSLLVLVATRKVPP